MRGTKKRQSTIDFGNHFLTSKLDCIFLFATKNFYFLTRFHCSCCRGLLSIVIHLRSLCTSRTASLRYLEPFFLNVSNVSPLFFWPRGELKTNTMVFLAFLQYTRIAIALASVFLITHKEVDIKPESLHWCLRWFGSVSLEKCLDERQSPFPLSDVCTLIS